MKKIVSAFLFLMFGAFPAFCLAVEATDPTAETVPGADLVGTLLGYLPESWSGWVTLVVTICAALSTVWPRPKDSASLVLRLLYTVVNAVGFNAGKAKNADDAVARALKL